MNILYRKASELQAQENPSPAHRSRLEQLHKQHPHTARLLAECNHSSFQKDEGHRQADTCVCRRGREPGKGAGMILGEDEGCVEHPEG